MATIVFGPNATFVNHAGRYNSPGGPSPQQPSGFEDADLSWIPLENLVFVRFSDQTANFATGTYSSSFDFFLTPRQLTSTIEFYGSGLTYDVIGLTGGTITGFKINIEGTAPVSVSDISLSATQLRDWSRRFDAQRVTEYRDALLGGSDFIQGSNNDDTIAARGGSDTIFGGGGTDTAAFNSVRSNNFAYRWGEQAFVRSRGGTELDRLSSVERFQFTDGTFALGDLPDAKPLQYIATYSDLSRVFGTDAAAGYRHFAEQGVGEGRAATFSGLSYIASYRDLAQTFGADAERGASHYISGGAAEGRTITFSSLSYIASYRDLSAAFGTNAEAGAQQYIQSGATEGRTITFDGLRYIASYNDLISVLPKDVNAAAMHFISKGQAEGRTTAFDPLQYTASNQDLITAFNTNETASLDHWLSKGWTEDRSTQAFNPSQYLANYTDLRATFGGDFRAATAHYIQSGAAEGRSYLPLV